MLSSPQVPQNNYCALFQCTLISDECRTSVMSITNFSQATASWVLIEWLTKKPVWQSSSNILVFTNSPSSLSLILHHLNHNLNRTPHSRSPVGVIYFCSSTVLIFPIFIFCLVYLNCISGKLGLQESVLFYFLLLSCLISDLGRSMLIVI